MKIAITGSTGFIGTHFCALLSEKSIGAVPLSVRYPLVDDFSMPPVDAIVHLAAVAHSDHPDPNLVYDSNLRLPVELAKLAKQRGVKQFVFLSSSLVWKQQEAPLNFLIQENPNSNYGKAKLEAEHQLLALQDDNFLVSIVRPSLVYGPGVKGNFLKLLSAVEKWPVCPLGVSTNHRSVTNVSNLCDFILFLIQKQIAGRYTLQDAAALSSKQMLTMIAERIPKSASVVELPEIFWLPVRTLLPGIANRLLGSFVVIDKSALQIGFVPRYTTEQGFDAMVNNFLLKRNEGKR